MKNGNSTNKTKQTPLSETSTAANQIEPITSTPAPSPPQSGPTPAQPAFEMTPSMLAIPSITNQIRVTSQNYAPSYTYRHPLNMHIVVGLQAPPVGPVPQELICPHCLQSVRTLVVYEPTHGLLCLGSCALLCILWPCVFVPYCMRSCQDANHYCPNCNAYIGTYVN